MLCAYTLPYVSEVVWKRCVYRARAAASVVWCQLTFSPEICGDVDGCNFSDDDGHDTALQQFN